MWTLMKLEKNLSGFAGCSKAVMDLLESTYIHRVTLLIQHILVSNALPYGGSTGVLCFPLQREGEEWSVSPVVQRDCCR